jgi:hypothetical protein
MAMAKTEAAAIAEVENMVKPTKLSGNLVISPVDEKKVAGLAKEGVKSGSILAKLKKKMSDLMKKIFRLEKKLEGN